MGVTAALLLAGALSAAGSISQGQATAAAAKSNIRSIQEQRRVNQAASRQQERRDASSNIVATAKGGVRMSGTPLEVLADNAALAEQQRFTDFNVAQQQIELLRGQRGGALIGSGLTAGGQLLGAAGQAGAYAGR